jgi:epsilon_2 antitoxin
MGFFDYEVALEILGQSKQPLVSALFDEYNKENPDQKLITFLEQKKAAIDDLMEDLSPDDDYLIKLILNPEYTALRK